MDANRNDNNQPGNCGQPGCNDSGAQPCWFCGSAAGNPVEAAKIARQPLLIDALCCFAFGALFSAYAFRK